MAIKISHRVRKSQKQLGKKIQKLRKKTGFSQEKFAERLDLSRTHVGHIEQGRKSPSIQTLEKIAQVLKVKPRDLL